MNASVQAVHARNEVSTGLTIETVTVRTVMAPLSRPLRTAVGEIPAAPLVLIDLHTREGVTGRTYLFAYTEAALAPLARLVETIGAEMRGREARTGGADAGARPALPAARLAGSRRHGRLRHRHGALGCARPFERPAPCENARRRRRNPCPPTTASA